MDINDLPLQMQKKAPDGYHLRIDPLLVNKFKRLPAGINEAGIKIVRDFGLKFAYDKQTDAFEIIGEDPEILHIAIETLRFWIEEDDYPSTGITCQIGYPNKGIVIWRFHGDYGKKFNHLFTEEINKLKKVPSLYVKAVPTKRNPEYVEVFCNFNVFQQVKGDILRISGELEKIFQTDVFVPRSDFNKAKQFARSKASDVKVLYALKEYPENNKIRVWIFSRDNQEVIRAKRDWIQHVGMIARDNKLVEEEKAYGVDMKSAVFYGHPSSAITSERSTPFTKQKPDNTNRNKDANDADKNNSFLMKTQSNLKRKSTTDLLQTSPRGPKYDHNNYPRPPDFVYPISMNESDKEFYKFGQEQPPVDKNNPFNLDKMENLSTIAEVTAATAPIQEAPRLNPMAGEARWVREDEIVKTKRRIPNKPVTNRIYVHLQVDAKSSNPTKTGVRTTNAVKVFHPEKNLIPVSKLNAKNVITSVTDPTLAPGLKKAGKNVRPGGKKVEKKPVKLQGGTGQLLKPQLQEALPVTNIRYQIKVNGLAIYMYKHFIAKLDNMDAIVNVVSTSLRSGGIIAEAIFDQAGDSVVDEIDIYLKMYGPLKISQNMVTSAGRIPAMGIIHVAAPVWEVYTHISEEECVKDLHKAIYDTLKTAERHQYRKIGLPVMSAEPYFGVPRQIVADVYVKALVDYSLAMGPLYPVLEIHIIDMDVELLNSIKESYEKWAASPAFKNIKTEFNSRESSVGSPTDLSQRSQSAVSMKNTRSHKSQNMVTFMEQSYTREGNQMWTFEVLKKLLVHVYTGTLLSVEGVEGLVCGTDTNLKGALAKQFLIHGGPGYERALKQARGKKELNEGDVIVSEGGTLKADLVLHSIVSSPIYRVSRKNLARLDNINNEVLHTANQMDIQSLALPLIGTVSEGGTLKADLVLHSIVSSPIYRVSRKNLARLDNINNEVLHTANQMDIQSLALPLIGTARLREPFEIEQCSLQLVDNIIEFSLSMEKNLRIKELHLVNIDSATTHCLTQALRTRAHTKLRIEVTSDAPSRHDVLSMTDGDKQLSDLHVPENLPLVPAPGQDHGPVNKENVRNVHVQARNRVGYLSEKNLKEHEKNMRKSAEEKQSNSGKIEGGKDSNVLIEKKEKLESVLKPNTDNVPKLKMSEDIPKVKPKMPKREEPLVQKTSRGNLADPPYLPRLDLGEADKPVEEQKPKRVKQRTPNRGPILQKSRAESYREIYERRRTMEEQRRIDLANLKRSRSIDNAAFSKEFADKVYEGFKTERAKLQTLRAFNSKMESEESLDMDELVQKHSNYFTRGTRERYRINAGHNIDDKDFEMTYKLDPDATINDMIQKKEDKQKEFQTQDSFPDRNMNSRFRMADRKREREERYMMDMGYDTNKAETSKAEAWGPRVDGDPNIRDMEGHSPAGDRNMVPLTDRSEISRKKRQERLENFTEPNGGPAYTAEDRLVGDIPEQQDPYTEGPAIRGANMLGTHEHNDPNDVSAEDMYTNGDQRYELDENREHGYANVDLSAVNSKLMEQFDQYVIETDNPDKETDYPNKEHIDAIAASFDQYVSAPAVNQTNNKKNTAGKTGKSKIARPANKASNNVKTRKNQTVKGNTPRNQVNDRLKKNQFESQPDVNQKDPIMTANNDYIDYNQMESGQINLQPGYQVPPRPEDVTIRDKLTLEIDVMNKRDFDEGKLEKEKKKIRRFWEVVDDSKQLDEKEIFGGEGNDNEKVLVAKVRKERRMSAKSKTSKSNVSTVTQPLGKYNVTVEVA